jgi:hypothetical protein
VDYPGNFYPNEFNYSKPSFSQEVTAPDVDPDDPDLEMILVQYNPEWALVLSAAVDQLMQYATWEGDHDAKILAVNRAATLKWLLQEPVDISQETPAPYWDTDEDVDDSAPADEQDWYGEVTNPTAPADELTFVENAVIWIFTGFIALVLSPALPAGVAAGLAFRTLATRFTLAFRRGDIIEQIRIVIDAKDYGTVNTGDVAVGDVIEVDVNGLEDLSAHDILLVVTNP